MYKKILSWLLTLAIILTLFAGTSVEEVEALDIVNIYVDSTNGDDENDGSISNSLKTIGKAIDKAEENPSSPVNIYLKEGDYKATEYIDHSNLTISAYHNGIDFDNVTIYPDYNSVLVDPKAINSEEWIFTIVDTNKKQGLKLLNINLSGDNLDTEYLIEDGAKVTGIYVYSLDYNAKNYLDIETCKIENIAYGIEQKYSDYIDININNSQIIGLHPLRMDNGYLSVNTSYLETTSTDSSDEVIRLDSQDLHAVIKNSHIKGNNGINGGIYGYFPKGEISNNLITDVDTGLEVDYLKDVVIKDNTIKTSGHGFELETDESKVDIEVFGNELVYIGSDYSFQKGIYIYIEENTQNSNISIYDNEIVNFVYGLYYYGYGYDVEDMVNLALNYDGSGNIYRSNIINMYVEDLRTTKKVDLGGTDWGTEDIDEVYSKIYIDDIYTSETAANPSATLQEAFVFDQALTTSAPEVIYVDDDFNESTPGYGTTHFENINHGKSYVKSGGTVEVAEGTYDEEVFLYQPVTINGSGDNTVLKNTGAEANDFLLLISSKDTTIQYMTFEGGYYGVMIADFDYSYKEITESTYGFDYYDSIPHNNSIINNNFVNQGSTSISVYLSYTFRDEGLNNLVLDNNTFENNSDFSYYGLSSLNNLNLNSPTIINNEVIGGYMNGFRFGYDGQASIKNNNVTIEGQFTEQFAHKQGFALHVRGDTVFENNEVYMTEGTDYPEDDDDSIAVAYYVNEIPEDKFDFTASKNLIKGFDYGIYLTPESVTLGNEDISVVIGGSTINCNNFSGNTMGVVSKIINSTVDARYNEWGVEDDLIPSMILDNNDDSSLYGPVLYLPSCTAESVITEITTLSAITVTSGSALELPKTVEVTYDDGSKGNVDVTWDKDVDTSLPGIYELIGSIDETELTASLQVIVEEAEETEPRPSTRPSIPKLEIKTEILTDGIESEEYDFQLEGNGGKEPYIWSAQGLVNGLEISKEGMISGIPEEAGDFSVKIQLLDSRNYYKSGLFDLKILKKELEDSKKEASREDTFTDIGGHWAENYINKIMEENIINGYPDGTFRPENEVTREEFASLLVRVFDLDKNNQITFKDSLNRWSTEDISTAAYYQIIKGYDKNIFGPKDFITREQMAVMIDRALKLENEANNIEFVDMDEVSTWAKDSIKKVLKEGLLEGYPDGTFRPKNNLTRAEAVKVISLIME